MIKKLVMVFVAAFALQLQAQNGTASPYSIYGIGSLKFKGTAENRSMGGLGIYSDSIHVNLQNPSGYAGNNLKIWNNENRPVKFTVGGSSNNLTLKSDEGKERTNSTSFDYLAMSFPLGKLGVGFGLVPYSAVGYKLESFTSDGNVDNRFKGEGGLNRTFLGLGYQITRGLSVGVEVNYNFGNIQSNGLKFRYDDEGKLLQFHSKEYNRSDMSGVNANFGLGYKTMITKKLELVTGLTYMPSSKINSENVRRYATVLANPAVEAEEVVGWVDADLAAAGLKETKLTLPSKYSFGAGIGQPQKWFAGAEYTLMKTSEFDNPVFAVGNAEFVDAYTVSLGGFYIPKYNSFSSYFDRVVYRAGMHFEDSGLKINDQSIKEFGISFGVGLPVGTVFSNANIGFEFGKRGTTDANLIQENFMNLQISLSLNDEWFKKRKFK